MIKPMTTPLRVLLIEDSQNDAELLLRELRRGGYAPEFERVETPEGLDDALARQSWDLIISDYAMPRFNGVQALKLTQEKGIDIPFVLVSGSIGEDVAVAAMKAGAHDYLMKGNLTRLLPAIARELSEVRIRQERRHAEETIIASPTSIRSPACRTAFAFTNWCRKPWWPRNANSAPSPCC